MAKQKGAGLHGNTVKENVTARLDRDRRQKLRFIGERLGFYKRDGETVNMNRSIEECIDTTYELIKGH